MNYKKAFSLFEIILVIFISSIVLIYSFSYTKELFETQKTNQELAILKIDLNSTKIILERNVENLPKKLSYENETLFLENAILLKDVNNFSIKENSSTYTINIKVKNSINKTWEIKK